MLIPNITPPENIRHQSEYVEAYMNRKHLGVGSLYIAESQVSWTKENSADGLCFQYPNIAIHAVSRDITNFQFPCLYLMLDINIDENNGEIDDSEDEEEDKAEMTDIRFVPRDPSVLDVMYKTLNDCQMLHPDLEDDFFGEEDEGSYEIRGGENADAYELYEENMEHGLENDDFENELNGHSHEGGDSDVDDVEMGQFDDVDQ